MIKLAKQQILHLHAALIATSGGSTELRDEGLLESALAAPWQEFAGISQYPDVESKAARLGFGLICNHPFVDGNKRLGAHAMLVFLAVNGIQVNYTQDDLIKVVLQVATDVLDCDGLRDWILAHQQ